MNAHQHPTRTFIRHPIDMPIDVEPREGELYREELRNLSLGGVSFSAMEAWRQGTPVRITISCCRPSASMDGHVAWCEACGDHYEVGVAFEDSADAYRMRLVEQACHIQQYRLDQVVQQGRYLTLDEAAAEWIQQYAPYFAPVEGGTVRTG